MMKTTLATFALLIAACTVTIPEGRFACERDHDCPPAFYCHQDVSLCYSHPGLVDGAIADASTRVVEDAALPGVDAGAVLEDAAIVMSVDAGTDAGNDAGCPPVGAWCPCSSPGFCCGGTECSCGGGGSSGNCR